MTTCPHCQASLEATHVVCIRCGYDVRTNRRLETASGPSYEPMVFRTSTPTCFLIIVGGWVLIGFVLGILALIMFEQGQRVANFFPIVLCFAILLAAIWLLLKFRRATVLTIDDSYSGRPVIQVDRYVGLFHGRRTIEIETDARLILSRRQYETQFSLSGVILEVLKLGFLTEALLGSDYRERQQFSLDLNGPTLGRQRIHSCPDSESEEIRAAAKQLAERLKLDLQREFEAMK